MRISCGVRVLSTMALVSFVTMCFGSEATPEQLYTKDLRMKGRSSAFFFSVELKICFNAWTAYLGSVQNISHIHWCLDIVRSGDMALPRIVRNSASRSLFLGPGDPGFTPIPTEDFGYSRFLTVASSSLSHARYSLTTFGN